MTDQIELPDVAPLPEVGGRGVWRANYSAGKQAYKIPVDIIQVRPGFNIRTEFNNIEELADNIFENELQEPLRGDLSKDGKSFWLTDGERRLRAIHLIRQRPDYDGRFDLIEVFPNPASMTDEERYLFQLSSDQKERYRPIEIAGGLLRLKQTSNLSNTDIAKKLGGKVSRQWVDNMIKLATQPEEVKEKILSGELTATEVVHTPKKEKVVPPNANISIYEGDDDNTDEQNNDEGFAEATIVHKPVQFIKGDDSVEMRQADKETRPRSNGSRTPGEKDLHDMKDEEIFCSETIKMLDKISVIADKIPGQAGNDINGLVRACIQRVDNVREFVRKAEIRSDK